MRHDLRRALARCRRPGARGAGLVEYALGLALLVVPLALVVDDLQASEQAEISARGAHIGNPESANLTAVTAPPGTTTTTTSSTTTTTPPPTTTTSTTTTTTSTTTTPTPFVTTTTTPLYTQIDVFSLTGTSAAQSTANWTATVLVTVRDGLGAPVGAVTISGTWSANSSSQTTSCTTNSTGTCTLTQQRLRRSDPNQVLSTTFTLTNVVPSLYSWYDPLYSAPSSVTVNKP